MTVKLSAAIITYNESAIIVRCINALKAVADDIVVVDSFSKDDTVALAQKAGARVTQHAFEGHIQQKNYAISQCQNPYILSVDADEILSPALQNSIQKVKDNWQFDGYYLNRCTQYCGRWIKHGDWYPDWKLRLWDSRSGVWGGQNPHDKFELKHGSHSSKLKGDLLHYSYNNISEHLQQMDKFTDIACRQMFNKNTYPTFINLYFKAGFHFFKSYYLRMGFLDGWQGYSVAKLSAMERVVRYSKLKDLYRLKNNDRNISH